MTPPPFNFSRNICKSVAEKFLLKILKNQNVEKQEIYRNKWISFNKIHVFHSIFLFCDCYDFQCVEAETVMDMWMDHWLNTLIITVVQVVKLITEYLILDAKI